jgi:hypothetical protein
MAIIFPGSLGRRWISYDLHTLTRDVWVMMVLNLYLHFQSQNPYLALGRVLVLHCCSTLLVVAVLPPARPRPHTRAGTSLIWGLEEGIGKRGVRDWGQSEDGGVPVLLWWPMSVAATLLDRGWDLEKLGRSLSGLSGPLSRRLATTHAAK